MEKTDTPSEPTDILELQDAWLNQVDEWFKELDHMTYFVPNIHMNKLNYQYANGFTQEADKVYVTMDIRTGDRLHGEKDILSSSDVIDDLEAQRLLHCMRALAKRKLRQAPMVVLTQMKFQNYLSEFLESFFAKPGDLGNRDITRGDFDLLVIHRHYGLLVGELKGIGTMTENSGDSFLSDEDSVLTEKNMAVVKKRMDKALKQLDKEVKVLSHLTSHVQPRPPRIRRTLMLPNLWRSQVRQVFDKFPDIEKEVAKRLEPPTGVRPECLCLCADDVPRRETSHDITDDVLVKLEAWFERVLTSFGPDEAFEEFAQYKRVVSRFVGPASTVSVFCVSEPRKHLQLHLQTEGQAVSWAGSCFTQLVLHPTQVDHLSRVDLPRAFLFGPPGTGKSVMLVLKAVQWLRASDEIQVIVLCAHQAALAAACMVDHQVRKMVGENLSKRLRLLVTDKTKVIGDLMKCVDKEGRLFVIADEAAWYREAHLCDELYEKVPKLHLWAAHCRKYKPPKCLELINLDQALRFPPSIRREIENTNVFKKYSAPYAQGTVYSAPLPTDGQPVLYVYHGEGEGHNEGLPGDCVQCGREVAKKLKDLDVGKPGVASSTTASPVPLRYSDVLLVTYLKDPFTDYITPAGGIIEGLRRSDIPITVVRSDDTQAISEMATMSHEVDQVITADFSAVGGLERKVVVVVDCPLYDDRFYSTSRCTSQLIWVTSRGSDEKEETEEGVGERQGLERGEVRERD